MHRARFFSHLPSLRFPGIPSKPLRSTHQTLLLRTLSYLYRPRLPSSSLRLRLHNRADRFTFASLHQTTACQKPNWTLISMHLNPPQAITKTFSPATSKRSTAASSRSSRRLLPTIRSWVLATMNFHCQNMAACPLPSSALARLLTRLI